MREVRFKRHPAVGGHTFPWQRGTVLDLLLALPVPLDFVPPLAVINDLLSKGNINAGMSGGASWKPFSIDQAEYEELVEEMLTLPGYNFVCNPALAACATYDEFWLASDNRRRTLTETADQESR